MLDNLLCWLGVNLSIEKWFKQTLCVSYFTKWILTCEHSRHFLWDILRRIIWVNLLIDQWFNQTLCVTCFTEHTCIILAYLTVMNDSSSIDFWLLYNKELIQYLISIDGEVVIAYCIMPGPESDFHLLIYF